MGCQLFTDGFVLLAGADTDNQLNEEQGESEYRNVQVVNSIDSPTLHMIKRLRELKPSRSEDTKVRSRIYYFINR